MRPCMSRCMGECWRTAAAGSRADWLRAVQLTVRAVLIGAGLGIFFAIVQQRLGAAHSACSLHDGLHLPCGKSLRCPAPFAWC